jgi:hypothetical protein
MMMKKVMAINPPAPPKNALVMFVEPGSGAFDDTVLLACSTRPGGRPADPTSMRLKFQSKFSTPQLTSDAEVKSSQVKSSTFDRLPYDCLLFMYRLDLT